MSVRLYTGPAHGVDMCPLERNALLDALQHDGIDRFPRRPRDGEYLRTEDGTLVWIGEENGVLPVAWLADEYVTQVAQVIRRAYRHHAGLPSRSPIDEEVRFFFTTLPADDFLSLAEEHDEEIAPVTCVSSS